MALLNCLWPGAYGHIGVVDYMKGRKEVHIGLHIYSDTSLQMCLANFSYSAAGLHLSPELYSRDAILDIPSDVAANQICLVASDAAPALAHCAGGLARWDGIAMSPQEPVVVYDAASDDYLVWSLNPQTQAWEWQSRPYSCDQRRWDRFFGPSAVYSDNSNLLRQCYLWLKTLPQFANCADA